MIDLIQCRFPNIRHIKKGAIYNFILYTLLLLPYDCYRILALYSSETPSYIHYNWLDYSFNIIHLFILAGGFLLSILCCNKTVFGIISLMLLREILFLLLGFNSCFENSAYEIYLALFVGFAFWKLVEHNCQSVDELEHFFWKAIFLNILTVFIAPLAGKGIISGAISRFNAVNMDVGSTGTICALLVIFCCFNKKVVHQALIAGIALIALFLSGSRINLLLLFMMVLIGALICTRSDHKINRKWFYLLTGIAIIGTVAITYVILMTSNSLLSTDSGIGRMVSSFSPDKMESDDSVIGRTTSILVGLDIIYNNPFGISGFFINLQNETIQRGFPTFPHSSMLDYYIFLGPIILLAIARVINCLKRLYSNKKISQFLALGYLVLFVILSGGPIINFKIIFFYVAMVKISMLKENAFQLEGIKA